MTGDRRTGTEGTSAGTDAAPVEADGTSARADTGPVRAGATPVEAGAAVRADAVAAEAGSSSARSDVTPVRADSAPQGAGGAAERAAGTEVRVRAAGRRALLVELADAERAAAFHAELVRRRAVGTLPPVEEIVPGARTVLLDGVTRPDELARRIARWDVPARPADDAGIVEIPVRYDGPDLAQVAALWGVGTDEAAARHSAPTYRVAFCGFAPGFGYLTGLPPELHVPRRDTPRARVPAGAVAIAGPYSAVYPRASPGGWQLIGTMPDPAPLWDLDREEPALLTPGTRVRFVAEDGTP